MTDGRAQIVISGAGLITSLGATRQANWEAILANRCGIGPFTEMEPSVPKERDGGQAVDLPGDEGKDLPREVRYLRHAIVDALKDAGVLDARPYEARRCGYMLGTTLHGMRSAGRFLRTGDFAQLRDFLAGATLDRATRGLGLDGPAATTCSACSSSLGAIALAVTLLQSGELDLVVAGGYDTISEYAYAGFNSLRLVATGPLRPFARDRQGMKLSEGYGIVVLERADDARKRGATVLATILGYGESADAHHLTQPHPEGEGAARAIAAAMNSAGVTPGEIDLIAAHATGTPNNDAGEYSAMNRVFAANLSGIPVIGFKSHLGHTLGGAGAVELILSAMALKEQKLPACANVKQSDTDFVNLKLSTEPGKPARIRATLNTSLGFGGANTCVVLGSERSRSTSGQAPAAQEVFITGVGVVFPGIVGNDAFAARLNDPRPVWEKDTGSVDEASFIHLLNARRVRRMSDYVKLTLAATALALADAKVTDTTAFAETCSVILGSAHGSANYSQTYYKQIVEQGLIGANPMLFAEGVPNAAAAHLSLMLSLKGACQTVIGSRNSGLDALRLAWRRIGNGEWDRAIVGAAEEFDPVINAAYRHCGVYAGVNSGPAFGNETGFVAGAGAVTLILESRSSIEARGTVARGKVLACASVRATAGSDALLSALGDPRCVIASANATCIDQLESSMLGGRRVTSLYGHVAETFSVNPLASIAALLLTGRGPRNLDSTGQTTLDAEVNPGEPVGVISSDYNNMRAGTTVVL